MGNHLHGFHHWISNIDQIERCHYGSDEQIEQVYPFHPCQIHLKNNRYHSGVHEGDIQTAWYAERDHV
jgi:hypothetical protein